MGMSDCIGVHDSDFHPVSRAPDFRDEYCNVGNCVEIPEIRIPTIFAIFEVCKKHYDDLKYLLDDFAKDLESYLYHTRFHAKVYGDTFGWGSTSPNPRRAGLSCDHVGCCKSNGFEGDGGKWHGSKIMLIPTIYGCFQVCDEHHIALREELHEAAVAFEILKDRVVGRIKREGL